MASSGWASLDEAYGSEPIKNKKNKKKKEQKVQEHEEIQKMINVFDDKFQEKSGIMPFGTVIGDNYQNIQQEDKTHQGKYFPFDQYTLNGQRLPKEEVAQEKATVESPPQQELSSPTSGFASAPNATTVKGNPSPISSPQAIPQQPDEGQASTEEATPVTQGPGVYITNEEYKELLRLKNEKHSAIINEQRNKSQLIESFSNINDDFNDVLLFGLMGIFFLIFTDYIYKLGRKSY
ncbi:MAG: hypothetical protein CMG46_02800 [Candidatus Marinimicrobia bacterium]|nr:hypothetical protein [Candidatus Neomarinimicrobiota bacterium]|tara:strand:+ start:1930 stop:2634 length:705 start_codon:yes stop_codon:yes gene_type:complete